MKEEIENYLIECGFTQQSDDVYTKQLKRQVGEMVVNGEHKIQVETLEFYIQYIGECWEGNSETDNHPLTQWKLIIQDEDHGDFLVHDAAEFKEIFTK
jgi:hypothetical protein